MHKSVVMVMAMSAGLTSGAFGQNYTYESRLVLDNDPLLAQIGVNYGSRALLPGASATAVGVTLVVRVTSQGTFPNYGLSSITGGGAPSSGVTRFTHDDAVSNQTNAMWSSPSLAFSRGYINATTSQRGAMNTGVSFRQVVDLAPAGAQADMNTERNNPVGTNQPYDSRTNGPSGIFPIAGVTATNSYTTGGALNGNGWFGPIGAPGTPGQIAAAAMIANGGSGGINYSASDQDTLTPGVQAPWQALYHLVFQPRTVEGVVDPVRDVTVSFRGYGRAAVTATFGAGTSQAANPLTEITSSVTFTVPAPGACMLLAISGVLSSRRRRV